MVLVSPRRAAREAARLIWRSLPMSARAFPRRDALIPHSGSMPASLIIFADLTSCTLTNSPSSSGVLENASNPTLAICAFTLGSSMILRISLLSRVTMSGGVPAGAKNPAQDSTSKPVSPDSSKVGRSGSSVLRTSRVIASARSVPGLHVRKAGREVGEAHRDAAADHVVERRRHALVGHLENVDAGEALERLAGENARGVAAAIGELARDGPWHR